VPCDENFAMKVTEVASELEMGLQESQNQRDKRVEELWAKLNPEGSAELDFKGLQKGLRRIDHRQFPAVCCRKPLFRYGWLTMAPH
jgi:hypothetical protein